MERLEAKDVCRAYITSDNANILLSMTTRQKPKAQAQALARGNALRLRFQGTTLREVHCSLLAREKRGLDTHPRQLIHHTSGSVSTRYTEIHAPKELLNARSVAGRISIAALVRAGSGGRASAVDQAVRG